MGLADGEITRATSPLTANGSLRCGLIPPSPSGSFTRRMVGGCLAFIDKNAGQVLILTSDPLPHCPG